MFQHILRNPELTPISPDALRKFAPAVFSKEAHPDVSEKYGFIPTYKIVETLHELGYAPVEARNYMRRNQKMLQFTQHLLRFRKQGDVKKMQVGDVVPQFVVVGSHDRSSAFEFMGGLWRLVCSNGLLVSESNTVKPIVLRHTKSVVEGVVDAVTQVAKQHGKVFAHVDAMRKVKLTERQQLSFAKEAMNLRWSGHGDAENRIAPAALLEVRRPADNGSDVWSVFNRVQENVMQGGVTGKTKDGRTITLRRADSIHVDLRVNAGLWEHAMGFLKS